MGSEPLAYTSPNSKPVTIRPVTPADIPFMMNLERSCPTAAHWSEQQYGQLFQTSGTGSERLVLVMRGTLAADSSTRDRGETLLGFLVARRVASEWELENIVVAPEVRRKGCGQRLLDALLAHAADTHSESIFLEVRESNAAARALYHRAEFRQMGQRNSYYTNPTEDAILYTRNLSSKL
jgi:ribosomal-protein-alanine N-acetyltransferase